MCVCAWLWAHEYRCPWRTENGDVFLVLEFKVTLSHQCECWEPGNGTQILFKSIKGF